MGKKTIVIVSCLLAFALAIMSCKKKGAETSLRNLSPTETKGELKVLSATPKGLTEAASEAQRIVVIFDHPMVPLASLPEGKGPSFLKVAPDVAGSNRWLGTKAFAFIPDAPLAPGTEFRITVPAGAASLDGYGLRQDFAWSFETVRPRLVQSFPKDGERSLPLDSQVILVFNQPVDPAVARKFITLTAADAHGKTAQAGFSISQAGESLLKSREIRAAAAQVLVLEPRQKLERDSIYTVLLKAGLRGRGGPLGMAQDRLFRFEPIKTFRFERLVTDDNRNPSQPLRFQFSNPVSYAQLLKNVVFEPEVRVPDYYLEWDRPEESLWLDLPLAPETDYVVHLKPGLADEFGDTLGEGVTARFRTSSIAPSISMVSGQGIIESYGDLRYPVSVVNVGKIDIKGARVEKEGVIPLLTRPNLFWESSKSLNVAPGFFQMTRPLFVDIPRNERRAVPIDFADLVPEKCGFVFLQVATGTDSYANAFLQVTRLGVTAKFSADNNAVWVTDLKTGQSIPEASIEVRDDKNSVLWAGKTDVHGQAVTPGWKRLGLKSRNEWTKPRQWIFAGLGQDTVLISSDWGTGIGPYRFGISYDWNAVPESLAGDVFSERGIYRAGETVHIKGILRRKETGQWRVPAEKTVECEVQDPFHKSVFKGQVGLDDYGSFQFDLDTAADAALGFYSVQARVRAAQGEEKAQSVSGNFRVEAFRPAEFEVHLRSLKESYVFGETYEGEVRASYLSGGVLAGAETSWHLRLEPASFTPAGHDGYAFSNESDWTGDEETERSRLLLSGSGTLGRDGRLDIKVPLRPEKEKDTVQATLEATVVGPSRRSITNRILTLVHRGDFYIGLRPSTSFLEKGKPITLDVIAVDPQGKTVADRNIAVKLVHREWKSVRKAGVGGGWRWVSEKEDVDVAAESVTSKTDPVTLSFKPEKSGLYFFSGAGRDARGNTVSASTFFYVTGGDRVAWEQKDDDSVELVADKESYMPGETARILVKSPYEKAKALVTVERELVLESRVMDIVGSSSQIEVPLKPGFAPNVFVSVILVQGRTNQSEPSARADVGKPSFKIGYVELPVNASEKRLTLDILPEKKEYRPKDKVHVRFTVRDAKGRGRRACLTVAAVDLGVLNLIGYQAPDPFGIFYAPRPLAVETSETRLHVVGQRSYGEKGEDVGGGAGETSPEAPGLAQVELRGDFRSTAYWNPSLLTDESGSAEADFALPENLTTFRIMAVAQTLESEFGRGESDFRVSKPLQLLPSAPRFARVGDSFQAGVLVHNFSASPGNVTVGLKAEGIVCSDATPRTLILEAGGASEAVFPFEVTGPGAAHLEFTARMGQESDGLILSIPLEQPRDAETVALFDQTAVSKKDEVAIPEAVSPERNVLDIQASPTALFGLEGGLGELREYPYACLEQRLSAVLPYLVAPRLIADFKLGPMTEAEAAKYVKHELGEIASYQREESGGFGLWPDSRAESPYLTCYTVFALLKAREAGYDIDAPGLNAALNYLRSLLRERDPKVRYPYLWGPGWNTVLAFSLYDLALAASPEPAFMERLFAIREELSVFGQVLLAKAASLGGSSSAISTTLFDELLNKVKVTPTDAHFEEAAEPSLSWTYSSNLRTTAAVLQALVEMQPGHPLCAQTARWLVGKHKGERFLTTQENFYFFYALGSYYRTMEETRPDFKFRMELAAKPALEAAFRGSGREAKSVRIGLGDLGGKGVVPLSIEKDGAGTLFYSVRMTYVPGKKLEPRDEGISIMKRIESPDGKPLAAVKAGSLAVVTLDVVVPQETLFVAVDDPLPAGFEAVNATLLTESAEQQRTLDEAAQREGVPQRSWEGFNHIEMHDNRVRLFADSLTAGAHTHRYLIRALTPGTFQVPGSKAEQMYAPEVFGRTPETIVKIVK